MNANKPKPNINSTCEELNKLNDDDYRIYANSIIVIGIIILIVAFLNVPNTFKPQINSSETLPKNSINKADTDDNQQERDYWSKLGTIGDFTAGIVGTFFALGGFIYLYLSFKKQREANELQLKAFNHEKIEGRFFELIKLHRDNVSELSYELYEIKLSFENEIPSINKHHQIVTHRKVFTEIVGQFKEALFELDFLFTNTKHSDIYEIDYYEILKENQTLKERKINLLLYAKIDLIYLIVFFGLSHDGQETILSLTKNKYKLDFVIYLLSFAALKPKVDSDFFDKWLRIMWLDQRVEIFQSIIKKQRDESFEFDNLKQKWLSRKTTYTAFDPYYSNNYVKYYGGHQFRLGHYFRHIYQTVTFVNDQTELSGDEQYDYVKHLRGQFSTAEQILFFLNSISQLGRIWELEDKRKSGIVERSRQMVSDYQLIKNIPNDEVLPGIFLSSFYPDIIYEGFKIES